MTNPNTESLVVEFKKEVATMREREATELEIQSLAGGKTLIASQ